MLYITFLDAYVLPKMCRNLCNIRFKLFTVYLFHFRLQTQLTQHAVLSQRKYVESKHFCDINCTFLFDKRVSFK